jgi:hypothetical protein
VPDLPAGALNFPGRAVDPASARSSSGCGGDVRPRHPTGRPGGPMEYLFLITEIDGAPVRPTGSAG